MSTDPHHGSRLTRRAVLFGLLAAAGIGALPGAAAADFVFSPTLDLFLFKDGNPRVVGEDPVSEDVARAQLGLGFATLTRRTRWELTYRLYRETYRDDRILDNTGHRLYSSLRHEPSRRSSVTGRMFVERTQRQRIRDEIIEVPDSLVPRTTIDRLYLLAAGKVATGSRNFVTWTAGASANRYEDLPTVDFNDSDQGLVGAGWGRNVSRRTSLGLAYAYRHIEFELTPTTDTQTLDVTFRHELGEKTDLEAAAGVIRLDRGGESDTTPSFLFNIRRELDRYNDLLFGLRRVVSPGVGIGGPTEDQGGYVRWRLRKSRLWWAEVATTYWHREVAGSAGSGTEGFQTLSSIWWTPLRYLSAGLFHSYTDQNALGTAGSSSDTSYNTGGFSLRWEILGDNYGGLRRGR